MLEPTIDEILQAAQTLYEHGDSGFSDTDFVCAGVILKTKQKQSRQIFSLWTILKPYEQKLTELGVDFKTLIPPDPFVKATIQSKVTIGARVVLKKVDTRNGARVAISAPYDEHLVSIIKTLKGREFDKEGKIGGVPFAWLIPSTPVDIEMAIATFKAENCVLDVDPALNILMEEGKVSYQESRAETAELSIPTKLELYPFQKAGVKWADDHDGRVIIADEMGLGKAQPVDSKILTPSGWLRIGDALPGMEVFGSDGFPHKIIGIFPQGLKEIYRVIFSDESSVECCDDHLWTVNSALRKWQGYSPRVLPLREIRKHLFNSSGNAQYFIPIVQPIQFQHRSVPLDPYLLGALIGDGSLKKRIAFSTADKDMVVLVSAVLPSGIKLHKRSGKYDYDVSGNAGIKNIVKSSIEQLGLTVYAEKKFIPEIYKFGDIDQRIAILQGLMDTDGYVSKDGRIVQFNSSSEALCQDVRFLIESLGGKATSSSKIPTYDYKGEKKTGLRSFTLTISLPPCICPFRLPRKRDRFKPKTKYPPHRSIIRVESVGIKEAVCIAIDSQDSLYVTEHCILTHNTPQSLGYLVLRPENALPALILIPSNVRVTWYRAVSKFTDLKPLLIAGKTIVPSFRRAGLDVSDAPLAGYDVTITNYDLLSVETPRTWLRNLLSPKKDLEVYGEKHLAWAGMQAYDLLKKAMAKYKDIQSRNRINRVIVQIDAQGSRARKLKGDPEYKIVFVNGVPFETFVQAGYKTLICDESHYLKDIGAQRTVAAIEISETVKHAICLTGTPIDSRPMELWTQIQIVNKGVAPKRFDYGLRYCAGYQKPAARGEMVWDFSGVSNIAELDKTLRSTIMIRRTKDQVMKELPPKTRTMIPFMVEESQEKLYRKEEAGALDRLRKLRKERSDWKALLDALPPADRKAYIAKHAEKAHRTAGLKDLAIAEIEGLKEAAVNAKFSEAVEFTAEKQSTQGKVLVFAVHHKTIDRLVAAFKAKGIKTDYIDGRVTGVRRQNVIDAFQDGDLEILVCGIRAMSVGANLVACHTVVFIELDWTPGIHSQAEDRTHRIGQTKPVTVYYLLLLGSIEEKIARMIDSKREVVNSILGEGDRTTQEAGILDAVMDELLEERKAA